jgi:hypothetical protein
MSGLKDTATREREIEELRLALDRALRNLDTAKRSRQSYVDAVYRATKDAMSAMVVPPVPKPVPDKRKGKPEVAVGVLSDWQLGKLTPSYNSEVCDKRIEQYGNKVVELTRIQRLDHPVRECHLFVLGDIIEGELIFPGQQHRIDASLYRQLGHGQRLLVNLIRKLLGEFSTVVVHMVDGNHGALGGPFRREYHPESNADRIVYHNVKEMLELIGEKRVSFNFPDPAGERNWYAIARIGNYTSLLIHGDQYRTTAGMPWYSVQKKAGGWALGAIMELTASIAGPGQTDIDFGHWHQPTKITLNSVTARCNGSTESYNTYAQEQLAAVGSPQQGLRFVEPVKGIVTAEYPIYLE